MRQTRADEKILSYNDCVLRRSDLDILSGPHYLNDRLIEFYLSYLSSHYSSDDILLVPPSIAFWIANCPNEESLQAAIEPLNLPAKKLIVFTVNDNEDVNLALGGSHWSLLAFDRNANVFIHHDSLSGSNSRYARRLYKIVALFVGSSESELRYVDHAGSPQQTNGYDCGLFVLAIARAICQWHTSGRPQDQEGSFWLTIVKEQVTPHTVQVMRGEILQLIKDLMAAN